MFGYYFHDLSRGIYHHRLCFFFSPSPLREIVFCFGSEFSGQHPCSVALREQGEEKFWKESKKSIVYGGKEDSNGPRIILLESLPKNYDC